MPRSSRLAIVLFSTMLWPAAVSGQSTPWPSAAVQDPPERPVSRQELEDLRRQIFQEDRSSLELVFDTHGETGDLNNKLDFLRYGARLNIRWRPSTTLSFSAQRTPYRTRDGAFRSSATSLALGARWRASEGREWQAELAGTRFEEGDWSMTGLASVTLRPSEALRYSVTLRSVNVEESLLSVAGLRPSLGPFAGQRVGGVHDDRLVMSGAYRLPARFEVFGEASVGSRSGSEVDGNFFRQAGGGLGFAAVARPEEHTLSLFRLSLSVDYFGFDEDRLGYGGASLLDARGRPVPPERLGSDGISPIPSPTQPGVGGYFSPNRFVSRVVRVDARGRIRSSLDYDASVFLGAQSFTGSPSHRAGGVSAGLTCRISERLTLPLAYTWDDFGPFAQQSLVARLVLLF